MGRASKFVSLSIVLIPTETTPQQLVQADGLQHRMLRGVISALSVVYVHVRIGSVIFNVLGTARLDIAFVNKIEVSANE